MSNITKRPNVRPTMPNFSSGPCPKRPGWDVSALNGALTGRSHRSRLGREKIGQVLSQSRKILKLPADYQIGITPASDTGAFELALWNLLGQRGVDVLAWESFGKGWVVDIVDQLKIEDTNVFDANYGELPDLSQVSFDRDVIFTWNGTTSGVKVPDGDWIPLDRSGLTICDATSAVFAMDLPWEKLDVVTYSWQKSMGGEGQHGVVIFSPSAIKRLNSYTPSRPLPKIFRLKSKNKVNDSFFDGATINTPSMLCVEDALDGLEWAEKIGGLDTLLSRSDSNLAVLSDWVSESENVEFLARSPDIRSNTSVCLNICAPWFQELDVQDKVKAVKVITNILEEEAVAYDIESYREAPPGLRIWAGATVESEDIRILTGWIDWAISKARNEFNL